MLIPMKGKISIVADYDTTGENGSTAGSTELSFIVNDNIKIPLDTSYDLTDEGYGPLISEVAIKDIDIYIDNSTDPEEDDGWTNEYRIYSIHFTPLLEN